MEQENCIFTAVTSAQVVRDVTANSGILVGKAAEIAWNLVSTHKAFIGITLWVWGRGLSCPACTDGTVYPVKVSLNSSV